jgi:transposase
MDRRPTMGCMAHARHKFHDIHAAHPSPTTTGALERIGALYRIEEEVRGRLDEERRAIRQGRAAPLLEENSGRGWRRRCGRCLRRRRRRRPYAIRSRAGVLSRATSMTASSRSIIQPPSGRSAPSLWAEKTISFAGSDGAGESAAAFYTPLGTARLNRVDPERWLPEVLRCIADQPLSGIAERCPGTWPPIFSLSSNSLDSISKVFWALPMQTSPHAMIGGTCPGLPELRGR